MSERLSSAFLRALRRLVRQVSLYPDRHPLTTEALIGCQDAVQDLANVAPETIISILENAFYHDRSLLAHTSLEFHVLLGEMKQREIESITLLHPVSGPDLTDLAKFIAGIADDLPADGTIRLNDSHLSHADITTNPMSGLRGAYTESMDALRLSIATMASDREIELTSVVSAVESLFEHTVSQPGASLLLSTVKSHDEYTFFHSVNTGILALAFGRSLGIDRAELVPIGVGAVLHDIGKVAVSSATLNWPGTLDDEQWREIKIHPQEGGLAIMAAGGPGHEIAATVAFEHHARFDGAGYPEIDRTQPPRIFSRLVTVVDTYDAITTRRAYRRAETPHRALKVLLGGMGGAYDPDLVRAFIRMMGIFPPGSVLEMEGGELVVVVDRVDTEGVPLPGLLVKAPSGESIEPEPYQIVVDRVVRQVLPQQAGVDPASLIEAFGELNARFT
jgi:HD-GYP domain-containing protein (c-di-GMP phosphodiesterase class II)